MRQLWYKKSVSTKFGLMCWGAKITSFVVEKKTNIKNKKTMKLALFPQLVLRKAPLLLA